MKFEVLFFLVLISVNCILADEEDENNENGGPKIESVKIHIYEKEINGETETFKTIVAFDREFAIFTDDGTFREVDDDDEKLGKPNQVEEAGGTRKTLDEFRGYLNNLDESAVKSKSQDEHIEEAKEFLFSD